jgi:uncharacterized protein YdhG (YjbR/CyaY superfamily)
MNATSRPRKSTTAKNKAYEGFTEDERAAMKEHAKELKAANAKADAESDVLGKIAEMTGSDRALAERVHAVIRSTAPELTPRLWYGMPAYAKDGKLVCHFQPAQKFKTRYATFTFSDNANLDDGAMWPVSYALTKLSAAEEKTIVTMLKKAVA